MRSLFASTGLALLLWATPGYAQSDFSGLKIKPGDVIYVTTLDGIEVSGALSTISPSMLAINEYEFRPERGLKVERRGDSILDGVLKGAAWAGVLGFGTAGCASCFARVLAIGMTIGAIADDGNVGRTKVFQGTTPLPPRSTGVRPFVTPDRKGVALAFSF